MSSKRSVNKKSKIHKRSAGQVKAQIFFSGRVQRMGFRSKAKEEAQMLGLKGFVENLKDGRVRVLCEGPRPKILEFIKIMEHSDELATVEKVRTYYSTYSGSFKEFEVKGGKFEDEMWQGFGTAERHLASMNRKLDTMGQDVKSVGKKVEGVGKKVEGVGQNVQAMHGDMNRSFDGLGQKVEGVGTDVKDMHGDMNRSFIEMDGRYHTIGENLEKMNANVKGLTDAIKEMVEDNNSEKHKRKDQMTGQT